MKASSFTKSPNTFVPLQARIWHACTAVQCYVHTLWREHSRRVLYNTTCEGSESHTGRQQATEGRDIIRPIAPSSSMGGMPLLGSVDIRESFGGFDED
jgi:hypothetical protein